MAKNGKTKKGGQKADKGKGFKPFMAKGGKADQKPYGKK